MRYIFPFLIIFVCLSVAINAIQLDFGFSSEEEALETIRKAGLSKREALYYQKLPDKVVRCQLCPNYCLLKPGKKGLCGNRVNIDGKLYTMVYGKPISVHIDPIEKKPLSHFLPGTTALSIATAGCNLGCIFCQNWQISQAKPEEAPHYDLYPKDIVELAKKYKTPTIAYTYTEPTVFYEYMLETAKLARKSGIKNIMHSCGYINEKPLKELLQYMDACNIDLKGFSEEFYQEMCNGRLEPVLNSIKTIKEKGVWLEITNLIIPGKNDDPKMIRKMCIWIRENLGKDVPIYFAAFHPAYKLTNIPPTPVKTLEMAAKIAKEEGLNYVFIGNVFGHTGEHTYCPKCKKIVIKRKGYTILEINLKEGRCKFCGEKIPGVWE